MARKFLYVFAGLIVLVLAGAFAYRFFGNDLMRMALVPKAEFRQQASVAPSLYDEQRLWLARPDIAGNPALWTPAGYAPRAGGGGAAVFFIHPTSYVSRDHWNAPIDDRETNDRTTIFLRGQASAFNGAGEIWAPRYRQATFGAFLTSERDADRALQLAYRDISSAFDSFLGQIDGRRPIILAGHSQGALHLTWLLRRKIAADPKLARRIVAAYVVGWPVSRVTDLPQMGLAECRSAEQTGCILSWLTFAEPADPSLIIDTYDRTRGFDGQPRRGTPMICTNPLTGTPDADAPAAANLGTLYPAEALDTADIVAGRVPARCAERGLLMIGEPPEVGPYVLPGNNYHVYDYSLFWANVRADAERRLAAFRAALPGGGRLIGLDVGTKTIGTALCDAGWSFASPATLIRRTRFTKDREALVALMAAQAVKGVVIGLPLNLDGSQSPRSQSSRAFARLVADLGPVLLWDERWSTVAVERVMIEQDMSRARRAERIDNLAAAHILQGAIDALVTA